MPALYISQLTNEEVLELLLGAPVALRKKILYSIVHDYMTQLNIAQGFLTCRHEGCGQRFSGTFKLAQHVRANHLPEDTGNKSPVALAISMSCHWYVPLWLQEAGISLGDFAERDLY